MNPNIDIDAIKNNDPDYTTITYPSTYDTPYAISDVLTALKDNTHVTSLSIYNTNIASADIVVLANIVARNYLHTLILENINTIKEHEDAYIYFFDCLSVNSSIKLFDISDCYMTPIIYKNFLLMLSRNETITRVGNRLINNAFDISDKQEKQLFLDKLRYCKNCAWFDGISNYFYHFLCKYCKFVADHISPECKIERANGNFIQNRQKSARFAK